jgi:hypothetical protein
VHVELARGVVAVLPAWKLDAVYCASLKVGAPQVSLAALCALHELLIACESRQVSADDSGVTEAQDGTSAIARTKDGACSEAGQVPRSRGRAASGHDAGGAPSSSEITGHVLLEASGIATQEAGDDHA